MRPIVVLKKTLLCVTLCCAAYFSFEFKGDTFRQRSLANIEIHDSELKPTSGFVVLGMHRSGTSMISGLLVEGFGYKTGGPLLEPASDNEKGFFELSPAVNQNQVFLYDQLQLRDAWNHPNIDSFNHEIAIRSALNGEIDIKNLRNVTEQLNDAKSSPWLLKDPRLCITFQSWLPFLNSKPAVVFTYRNPLSVAKSLNIRDRLPLIHGLRLWIVYNKAAIQNSAHMCRVTTSNNAILQDPFNEVLRISNELTSKCNVPPPPGQLSVETVDSFIDPTLQHNQAVRKLQEESLPKKQVIEVYNDCDIYEYPSWQTDAYWKQLEMDMYLKAMRIHCDLESGVAYNADYVWPNLQEKVKTNIAVE
ncbi:hypothetical protein CTEN210_12853 [Chaetoceros tenuissimus]|uniref:Protein-tyrosine sulfotransferase n=1 Tax=Chaetoceros tenuissimus TaxID=426638 RepID=A0AAD3D2G3_9STRA|nr:hypothetical protein CTEN210_12853 [Chaetoceros tenuissimus]